MENIDYQEFIPPVAKTMVHETIVHQVTLSDEYYWLKEHPIVQSADILSYLAAENEYFQNVMSSRKEIEENIYQEIIARIKLEDQTVPLKRGDYFYYNRTETKSNYPIFCRKKHSLEQQEQILLDVNELSKSYSYFSLGSTAISFDHQKIAYSSDENGSERFTIRVKDLVTNEIYEDKVTDAIGEIVWHRNNKGFFYAKLNDKWRVDKIYYHQLGQSNKDDKLIFSEDNHLFRLYLTKSNSEQYIFINSESKDSNEVWYIAQDDETMTAKLVLTRKDNHLYQVDHHDDWFYILTNDQGKNFRLIKTLIANTNQKQWEEQIAHSEDWYLANFTLYQDFFIISAKNNAQDKIMVFDYKSLKADIIDFNDQCYKASVNFTNYQDQSFRILYSSLNAPNTEYLYDVLNKSKTILKIQEILGGFNQDNYITKRLWAKSLDGVLIPISLVYRRELLKKDGSNPLYLYGYGSYGYAVSPFFRSHILSLLDRGFVYAIAHIRGGDDMGYQWYEAAKFLTKKRSFTDFIDVSEYLINEQYTSKGNIVISGGSAGGMLVGVCLNENPDLYKAAIAHVPFVDVLNTMLDKDLPLTPGEFREWGNPEDKTYFNYILSYSPYNNIKRQNYPSILVTAGLYDPRVTYWEPAKWVAKLRQYKTDNNLILLETNMKAGHAGASGRFGYLRDIAKEYNFIFKIFNVKK